MGDTGEAGAGETPLLRAHGAGRGRLGCPGGWGLCMTLSPSPAIPRETPPEDEAIAPVCPLGA